MRPMTKPATQQEIDPAQKPLGHQGGNGADDNIAKLLDAGDPTSHRSRDRARRYLSAFKTELALSKYNDSLDRAMEDFLTEVLLGAAWYQHHYKDAKDRVTRYIWINCGLTLAVPLVIMAMPLVLSGIAAYYTLSISVTNQTTAQITTLLTGILALQKTLATWYSSQQRYATWYKSASDLKTIYYQFIQNWSGNADADQPDFRAALAVATQAGRKVISDEQLDYYQKLALPSFDILDLLTSGRNAASGLVTSLMPNTTANLGALGKNVLTTTVNGPAIPQIPSPDTTAVRAYPIPGGPRQPSQVLRIAAGQGISIPATEPMRTPLNPGAPGAANWITCAFADCQKQITVFETTWLVPNAPTDTGTQLIYLFNGVQPANFSYVLQPVLQWGNYGDSTNDGDGPFWTVASWLVTNHSAIHTDHVRVYPGATVTGRISLVAEDPDYPGTYVYKCEFVGIAGTRRETPPIPPPIYCVNALEAYEHRNGLTIPYDLDAQTEYPASPYVLFTANSIFTDNPNTRDTPKWETRLWQPKFGEITTVDVNGNTISFGTTTSPSV
jgi:hypothetical protein